MASEVIDLFARKGIPQFHCLVITASCQQLAIRAETDGIKFVFMPDEGIDLFALTDIPQFQCLVITASC